MHPRSPAAARRAPHRSRLLVLLVCLSLGVAACGEEGSVEIEGTDADAADGTTVSDGEEDGTEAGADAVAEDEATTDGTTEPEPEPAADDGEGGTGEHRMAAGAHEAIDCDAVATSSPGAVIVFPDSGDPASLEAGPGPVTVEVVGCSDTFEANIQYDAFHGQNSTPTLSGFTEGGTLGDWAEFSFEETFWTPGDWTVVVFIDDAESGDRIEYDEVTFTVG
ncbi:MAG: hypothetical protein ACLFS9_04500 [Nitriliruptoraceae bacterium]